MRATYDRFAPYFNRNGLIKQLTLYETLEYTDELWRWEWYENREDLMEFIVHDFKANKVVEHFAKGRKDFLLRKCFIQVWCNCKSNFTVLRLHLQFGNNV